MLGLFAEFALELFEVAFFATGFAATGYTKMEEKKRSTKEVMSEKGRCFRG